MDAKSKLRQSLLRQIIKVFLQTVYFLNRMQMILLNINVKSCLLNINTLIEVFLLS